jgi:hypothetical protein
MNIRSSMELVIQLVYEESEDVPAEDPTLSMTIVTLTSDKFLASTKYPLEDVLEKRAVAVMLLICCFTFR